MTLTTPQRLLTQEQVARTLGVSARTLRAWTAMGIGPVQTRIGPGGRTVRYSREDLERFIADARQAATTDLPPAA